MLKNVKNALKSLALKATLSNKSASRLQRRILARVNRTRMDYAANGAIDALGEALFGKNNDRVVKDVSSQIREALVELAIDGDDANVKIKHPKAFAYFLRVTKSNSETQTLSRLPSLLESHGNNAKAL